MLTPDTIRSTKSDDKLFALLGQELERRLPNGRTPTDEFVQELVALPLGLRAMAATYELDVSLTLDDLGWHFGNWPHKGLALETLSGLRELGATQLADAFSLGLEWAERHWANFTRDDWMNWYNSPQIQKEVTSFNDSAYEIYKPLTQGLFTYWVLYARAYPERLI
jgi:hypothetical protein